MLQGSVRRRNAKQELSQRRQVRDDGAATMLQGSVRRRNAKQEVSQRRQVRDDGAATMLQGSVRRRNAKQELSQRRQVRDDGAATMLQGSVRRRNAKQELSQRRQVRDDGAATMLQGPVRTTQREAGAVATAPGPGRRRGHDAPGLGTTPQRQAGGSQRRQVRDDRAATMLQGSVRRRNAKEEMSQRRQAREDEADDAALRAAFGSPLYRIDRHGDDVVKTALDDMRKTLPRATAHLDRGQLASPTVREPSADYVANARSAAAKEQYIASRTRPPPPRQTKPRRTARPLGPAGPVRRWRAPRRPRRKINGERPETLLPYATPQIRRRQRPASAPPAGAGVCGPGQEKAGVRGRDAQNGGGPGRK